MDEKEELVKKALFSFVRKHVPTAQLRYRPLPACFLKNSAFFKIPVNSLGIGILAGCYDKSANVLVDISFYSYINDLVSA